MGIRFEQVSLKKYDLQTSTQKVDQYQSLLEYQTITQFWEWLKFNTLTHTKYYQDYGAIGILI